MTGFQDFTSTHDSTREVPNCSQISYTMHSNEECSEPQESHLTSPTLWVSDILAASSLEFFQTAVLDDNPQRVAKKGKQHILCFDPGTSEVISHHIAKVLQGSGCWVDVVSLEQRLADFIFGQGRNAEPMLLMAAQPYTQWSKSLEDLPLDLEQALQLAKFWMNSGTKELEVDIKLETLRKRANVSSFDWNRYIRKLEAEIHAAVDGFDKTSPAQRMKLDISAWLRITDPFEQEVEKARILSTYRLKEKSFERLCRTLREAEKRSVQKSRRLNLKEAFSLESHALAWLAPTFLPSKVSALLSGLPGSGKSLLSVDLAYAIVTGGTFLGERCRKGRVLLINSDQPLNITLSYLDDRGFNEDDTNIEVVGQTNDLAAWTIQDLDLLETWLDDFKPDLVIIDSIRTAICYPLGLEEKSEQVGHWMKEVERLVTRYGSLLWIHHDNKDKDLKGVSRASGSTAIPGNVSVHWRLETVNADPSNPNRRFSMPKTRGFEASTINIQFNPESGEWQSFGRAGENEAATASYQQQILTLLAQCPGVGMEGCEIRQAIGSDSVYTILGRLVAKGIISKRRSKTTKGKVYFLPLLTTDDEEPSPPCLSQLDVSWESKSQINQEIQTPNTTPNTIPNTHLTPLKLDEAVRTENVLGEPPLATSNTFPQSEGEGVLIEKGCRKETDFPSKAVGNTVSEKGSSTASPAPSLEAKVGERVFITIYPHTDRLGPYSIEWIDVNAGIAKVEGFASPIALVDLRKATE